MRKQKPKAACAKLPSSISASVLRIRACGDGPLQSILQNKILANVKTPCIVFENLFFPLEVQSCAIHDFPVIAVSPDVRKQFLRLGKGHFIWSIQTKQNKS